MMANIPHSYYRYDPSIPAAAVAAAFYTVAFIGTLVQFIRYRSWVWTIQVLASGMEAGGYIARCFSAKHTDRKTIFVVQYALIVLAPVLIAAACYIIFSRIVFHIVPKASRTTKLLWIPPRFITPIFVACDLLALVLQLWGALLITTTDIGSKDAKGKIQRGKDLAQSGVAIQLGCFGLFTIIAFRFNFTSKRFAADFKERLEGSDSEKYCKIDGGDRKLKKNWQALLRVVNFASGMILVRSIYRMVEFSMGKTGYPDSHEWVMYAFDTIAIFPCIALFVWWHPSKYLPYLGFRLPKHAR